MRLSLTGPSRKGNILKNLRLTLALLSVLTLALLNGCGKSDAPADKDERPAGKVGTMQQNNGGPSLANPSSGGDGERKKGK